MMIPQLVLLVLLLQTRRAFSIQVTPNSPCSSVCMDSSTLDVSDPTSSNTYNTDIVCSDQEFSSSTAGKKWRECVGCLQNSTFSQGSESDQAWFLYNVRYNFAYCIFGFPNASNIGSNPCQTSTACGKLQNALQSGIPGANTSEYDYCSVDGDAMTSSAYQSCLDCVQTGGTNIVANSLVALEAGCQQKSEPSLAVGLNATVFSTNIISIASPSATTSASTSHHKHRVATTTIAVVVVVSVLFLAAVAGFAYVCYRKRKSHRQGFRSPYEATFKKSATKPKGRKWEQFTSSEHITSPLSFQCRSEPNSGIYPSGIDAMLDLGKMNSASDTSSSPLDYDASGDPQMQQENPGAKIKQQQGLHHLPSIIESPYASPAFNPGDEKYRPSAGITSIATATKTSDDAAAEFAGGPPKLDRLNTSFGPHRFRQSPVSAATYQSTGSAGTMRDSPDFTPSSATGLLSFASQPGLSHPQPAAQAQHAPYVPAAYVANATAAARAGSGVNGLQHGGYNHPSSATSATSSNASPMNSGLSGRGYTAWSSVAQPPLVHQAQHHQAQATASPLTATSSSSVTTSPRPPSSKGLRSATMAARHSIASSVASAKEKEAGSADDKPLPQPQPHVNHRSSSSSLNQDARNTPPPPAPPPKGGPTASGRPHGHAFGRRRGSAGHGESGSVQSQTIQVEFKPPPLRR